MRVGKTIIKAFRNPLFQLAFVATASFLIYALVFVRPYSLFEWWSKPGLSIAKIENFAPLAGVKYVIAILLLFMFYWLGCRITRKFHDRHMWGIVIAGALVFNAVMLGLYPVDALDVFDSMVRARMAVFYGANPFYDTPDSVPALSKDPFFGYSGWHNVTTAYGPLWELIAETASRLPGNGVVANVLTFKLVGVLAIAGAAALIALSLRRQAPDRMLSGITALAWNPLVIYSIAGNAHNDAVMLLFLIWGFCLLARGHYSLAALAETAGALVKFIPALVFPVILIAGLKHCRNWGARIRYLAVTGVACAALVVGIYAPFWRGLDLQAEDWRTHLFTTSLPTLFKITLQQNYDPKFIDQLVGRGALLVLALWMGWQLCLLWRRRTVAQGTAWEIQVSTALSVLIFFLLVTCPWIQPWYFIWVIAIAALLPDGVLFRGAVVLSLAALFKMPVIDFLMQVRPGSALPLLQREWSATVGTLGIPWVYFLYQWLKGKIEPEYQPVFPDRRAMPRSSDEIAR